MKNIVVRSCRWHGMQIFYEIETADCAGMKLMQYRCAVCKRQYYERNSARIMQRQKASSAGRQAAYRRRAASEAAAAYCAGKICCLCGVRPAAVPADESGRKLGARRCAQLRRDGFPAGCLALCEECATG